MEVDGDQLIHKILEAIAAVENLRAEKVRLAEQVKMRLTEQVKSLEDSNLVLKSEVELLKLAVEDERAERRHYHSLADEIITRLEVVGQTIRRGGHTGRARSQVNEKPRSGQGRGH
jgi:hypothetical protein